MPLCCLELTPKRISFAVCSRRLYPLWRITIFFISGEHGSLLGKESYPRLNARISKSSERTDASPLKDSTYVVKVLS